MCLDHLWDYSLIAALGSVQAVTIALQELSYHKDAQPADTVCIAAIQSYKFILPPLLAGNEQGLTSAACSGICAAGYYCPEGSTSLKRVQCALLPSSHEQLVSTVSISSDTTMTLEAAPTSSQPLYDAVYCPVGSIKPLLASTGYYTVGGNSTTRCAL